MIWLLGGVLACEAWSPPEPLRPPETVVAEMRDHLESAVAHAEKGDEAAAEAAWRRAHEVFTAELEPLLRVRHHRAAVAATEYQFSVFHRQLPNGTAGAVATNLETQVRALLGPEVISPVAPPR